MSSEVYWKPVYKSPDWVWGEAEIDHWEIVVGSTDPPRVKSTGVYVFPNGRFTISNQEIH